MKTVQEKVYSVSEITFRIRALLEDGFPSVSVEGEISNFRPSSAGHVYFILKDQTAVLSAVMFKNRLRGLAFEPGDGQRVVARGSLSVYPQRGTYQLVCESLERAGEGAILAMLEERKRRLAALGLFDAERKKPLPLYPRRIAVITSPTGAAVRDILKVLCRRGAGLHVVILPAPVQGEGADEKIAAHIRRANRYKMADVIIVGRGGGSLEDLLPFSSEAVVRAIADSQIPVISAVGHEIDTSLSDYAADFRAPTPSAAAEAVSLARDELLLRVRQYSGGIENALTQRLEKISLLLSQYSTENLEERLRILLQPVLLRLDDAKERLLFGVRGAAQACQRRLELAQALLESRSPKDILRRGYAIVRRPASGEVIKAASFLSRGDEVSIRFYEGEADVSVKETRPEQVR
ncbi:MAG: exodeoxyribonuclease VII large subunit [Spirochaetales bacterium]|jgi:exodeoxyribonuclease VII large subunit|nr:exodeoxyribonuclease VII large subunit [Spirochaetales bacterium]